MIARIWKGRTLREKADEYMMYLKATGLHDYARCEGNRGVFVLRRTTGSVTEFVLISLWDSYDAIRKFAGEDFQRARYYAQDKNFLLEFEPEVSHFDVLVDPFDVPVDSNNQPKQRV